MASTFTTFKRLKGKGIAALKQGDYVAAKPYLIQAAESMIEIRPATRRYRDWAYQSAAKVETTLTARSGGRLARRRTPETSRWSYSPRGAGRYMTLAADCHVVEAIRTRDLNRTFADGLSPAARSAYFRCCDSKVDEDRYNPEIHDAPHDNEQAGRERHD